MTVGIFHFIPQRRIRLSSIIDPAILANTTPSILTTPIDTPTGGEDDPLLSKNTKTKNSYKDEYDDDDHEDEEEEKDRVVSIQYATPTNRYPSYPKVSINADP